MLRAIAFLALLCVSVHAESETAARLIGGDPVPAGQWQDIVYIEYRVGTGASYCTATIVGKRTILTAAHCARNMGNVTFTHNGKKYTAVITRSGKYETMGHDMALGYVAEDIVGAKPYTIGGESKTGIEGQLLGYGCTSASGNGGNDGILRIGTSMIVKVSNYNIILSSGKAITCSGDSGGPTFVQVDGKPRLLGIHSQSDFQSTSYDIRTDHADSRSMLSDFATKNSTVVCGINSTANDVECSGGSPVPLPSCNLVATPSTVSSGGNVTLALTSSNAVSADIDGTSVTVPNGEKRVNPTQSFTAIATVRNAAGQSDTCRASVTVTTDPDPVRPSCQLTAIPEKAAPNQPITLELTATGNVTYASISGNSVTFPVGRITTSQKNPGDYFATGFVRGPGGAANCDGYYSVTGGTDPEPTLPEFAVTSSACGANYYPQTGIKSACVATVKRDPAWTEVYLDQVVLLTNADGTQNALPLMAFKNTPGAGGANIEEWNAATGGTVTGGAYPLVEQKYAKLTKNAGGTATALEGRNALGKLYLVQQLSAARMATHLVSARDTDKL